MRESVFRERAAITYIVSSDVRRATLVNLPLNKHTLPAMLARTRDVDMNIRKLVYSNVLEPNCVVLAGAEQQDEVMGSTHPRVFSIEQRELLIRNGLGDREEAIKAASAKLVVTWLETARVGHPKEGANDIEADISAFLQLFDLVENSTAEDALLAVYKSRPDLLDSLELNGAFLAS